MASCLGGLSDYQSVQMKLQIDINFRADSFIAAFYIDITKTPEATIGDIRCDLANVLGTLPSDITIMYNIKDSVEDDLLVKDYMYDDEDIYMLHYFSMWMQNSVEKAVALHLHQQFKDLDTESQMSETFVLKGLHTKRVIELKIIKDRFFSYLAKYLPAKE